MNHIQAKRMKGTLITKFSYICDWRKKRRRTTKWDSNTYFKKYLFLIQTSTLQNMI